MTELRHLTDISSLSDGDLASLLDSSLDMRDRLEDGHPAMDVLSGRLQFNLFYENSTRTNLSFEVAGKRLGAIVSVVPVAASSIHKGESVEDTILTLAAQGADTIIIRAAEPGTINRAITVLERDGYGTSVLNAGEGALGHPTQGLLDAATLLRALGRTSADGLRDQTITLCGDVVHSRVAASAIEVFSRLGATIRLCAPKAWLPDDQPPGVALMTDNLAEALDNASVAMGLRQQKERMKSESTQAESGPRFALTDADYHDQFGLTHDRMNAARDGAFVMHPGPMNRGFEISSALADDPTISLIRSQVTQGVALRMAVLAHLGGAR